MDIHHCSNMAKGHTFACRQWIQLLSKMSIEVDYNELPNNSNRVWKTLNDCLRGNCLLT